MSKRMDFPAPDGPKITDSSLLANTPLTPSRIFLVSETEIKCGYINFINEGLNCHFK